MKQKITALNELQKEFLRWAVNKPRGLLIAPCGKGKCVVYDTPIVTNKGIVPIGSLFKKCNFIGWKDYSGAIKVKTPTGFSRIRRLYSEKKASTLKVTCSDGFVFECTPEHLIETSYHELISVGELKVGDRVTRSVFPVDSGIKEITEKQAYCLGLFLGDGGICLSKSSKHVYFLSSDKDKVDLFREEVLPLSNVSRKQKHKGKELYSVQSTRPLDWFIKFYIDRCCSYNKRLPNNFLSWNIVLRRALLCGILDTDGSISGKNIDFSFTNKNLCLDIQKLAFSLGYTARVSLKGVSKYTNQEIWRVRIHSSGVRGLESLNICSLLTKKVPKVQNLGQSRYNKLYVSDKFIKEHSSDSYKYMKNGSRHSITESLRRGSRNFGASYLYKMCDKISDDILYKSSVTVVSIELSTNNVYDIEVETSDHLYYSLGHLMHNSLSIMSLFLILRKRGLANKMMVFTKSKAMDSFHKANVARLSITNIDSSEALKNFYPGNPFASDIYQISTSLLVKLKRASIETRRAFFDLMSRCGIVAVDEIHNYRNYSSSVSQTLKQITDWYQNLVNKDPSGHRLFMISATPNYKALENWHTIMGYIEPRLFGPYYSFQDRYCIINQRNTYTGQKLYTTNGTHRVKRSLTFTEIIGYKNTDELFAKIRPYLFQFKETSFTFDFKLHYYELDEAETERYNVAIRGLGLDKEYHIILQNSNKELSIYRDKHDVLYMPGRVPIEVMSLTRGTTLIYDSQPYRVESVLDKTKDATHAVRLIRAQETVSTAKQKFIELLKLIKSFKDTEGCLVYFQYLDSIEVVRRALLKERLGRRVVVISGGSGDLKTIASSLLPTDIVLITKAASESIDFYYNHLILYESITISGQFEQLCGRLSRENSQYRDISVDFLIRPRSLEEYFYNRLKLSIKNDEVVIYAKEVPTSISLENVDPELINVQFLKENLLWKKQ